MVSLLQPRLKNTKNLHFESWNCQMLDNFAYNKTETNIQLQIHFLSIYLLINQLTIAVLHMTSHYTNSIDNSKT